MSRLKDKKILLGVSGGIAAYKTPDLVRFLQKRGAVVRAVMTPNAAHFVTPLSLSTLCGAPVVTDTFALADGAHQGIEHTGAAQWADAFLIAPATADLIARAAAGMADDALTTHLLAFKGPVLVCPAMNTQMLEHPATCRNLVTLDALGYHLLPPDEGELACGVHGAGRLPDPPVIAEGLEALFAPQDLVGLRVLITAGPTQEAVDPMRYLSNRSSGKMGYALAAEAARRGAEVTLVSGPTALADPPGLETVHVGSAREMEAAVQANSDADIVVMSAAVADFRPAQPSSTKLKKSKMAHEIALTPNPDILAGLGRARRKGQRLVGFAAESGLDVTEAKRKRQEKGLDMIVLNTIGRAVGSDTNEAVLIASDDRPQRLPAMDKEALAAEIINALMSQGPTASRSRKHK